MGQGLQLPGENTSEGGSTLDSVMPKQSAFKTHRIDIDPKFVCEAFSFAVVTDSP